MSENKFSGAEIILKAFINEGVDIIFGYPGGAILPFYDALFTQNKLHHILTRHEQAAAHAAEGYARSTGKVGVITVTSGPGATNAITGLTDAYLDSIPLICISGQVATSVIGTDGFQEADITGLTRSCTKHNYLVKDVNDLGYIIHEAFHIARSGRPGPVLIDIPKDVQNNHGIYNGKPVINRASYQIEKRKIQINHDEISAAIDLLENSTRPIFYTGGGIINSGDRASELLTKFVRETGFPITNTLMGLGGFPASDPHFIGMLGMHGTYEANMAMHDCDVMLNIGARFDDRVTGRVSGFSPDSKKIHVDVDDCSIDKIIHVDVSIVGDAFAVLEALLNEWNRRGLKNRKKEISKWWDQIKKWQDIDSLSYEKSDKIIKPGFALQCLNELTKTQAPFISTDVGQHQMWAAQYLTFDHPKKWLTSGGLGTMGYAVPAAMGAKVGAPDTTVWAIDGDGCFQMTNQELVTCALNNIPIKVAVINNESLGMVRQWQTLFYNERYSNTELHSKRIPDFAKLADAMGCVGLTCDSTKDVDKIIAQAMEINDRPVVVDFSVHRDAMVWPMVAAGTSNDAIVNARSLAPIWDSQEL
jgi:acetolactate synthase-1/2/3 large subunit